MHPSGWMTGASLKLFIKHFHNHVNSSVDHPCLLLLDNHDSHLSIDVSNFCKANGIILLSFPPHTSHRLQPLDKSVYGLFKKYYSAAVDNWMKNNPGKTITIYDIPNLVKSALPIAVTPNKIVAGFASTGIMPFNPQIFTDDDFLSSYVTYRPDLNRPSTELSERNDLILSTENSNPFNISTTISVLSTSASDPVPSTSISDIVPSSSTADPIPSTSTFDPVPSTFTVDPIAS